MKLLLADAQPLPHKCIHLTHPHSHPLKPSTPQPRSFSLRTLQHMVRTLEACCHGNKSTSLYLILSNKFSTLIDQLLALLNSQENQTISGCTNLCSLINTVLLAMAPTEEEVEEELQHQQALQDCIRLVMVGTTLP